MEKNENFCLLENNANRGHRRSNKLFYTIEPALTLVLFGWYLSLSIVPNQLLKQSCLTSGYNDTQCLQVLGKKSADAIEAIIQPQVAEIMMAIALLNSVVPALMSLLLGPWSDKFGRKKVICASFLGHAISLLLFAIVSIFADQRVTPWIYVACYIPLAITGGSSTMLLSIMCYVTDSTKESERSSRLAINEMMILLGVFAGTACSSYVISLTNATSVFLISTCCTIIAFIFTVTLIEESLEVQKRTGAWEELNAIFSLQPVIEMVKTCFKPRPFLNRRTLWCLITVLVLHSLGVDGTSNVFYLFVRQKLQWTLKEETFYRSSSILISIVGILFCVKFLKRRLNLSDFTLVFVGVSSNLIDALIKLFAMTSGEMYLSLLMCLFKVLLTSMCRSLIATLVLQNEVGKVFSMISSLEALASLIASPLYTFVYSQSFTTFAGAFYIINVCVCFVNLPLLLIARRAKKKSLSLVSHALITDYKTFIKPSSAVEQNGCITF